MLGSDLLVAPMFASGEKRKVYLPPGNWIDYQSGRVYEGEKWHEIPAGPIPVVLLVRNHSVIPHIKVAQSTQDMDWDNVELRVFSTDSAPVTGLFTRPGADLQTLSLVPRGRDFVLQDDPQMKRIKIRIFIRVIRG
jgi:alpha-D-xyloside xylohydrolase